MLAGLADQVTPVFTKMSNKESRDTEKILNLLKTGKEQTQKTLDQIDSTLSVTSEEVLIPLDGGICEGDRPVFVEVLPGQVSIDNHTVHGQSAAIKKCVI